VLSLKKNEKKFAVRGKSCIFATEIPPCMQITWVKPPSGGFILIAWKKRKS
jgi:hypothetical protein